MHRAYLFDPVQFHNFLLNNVIVDGRLSLDALYAIGNDILENANETTLQALAEMRIDPKYMRMPLDVSEVSADLDTDDEKDVHGTIGLYMIVLSPRLTPAPSLKNRLPHSGYILQDGLRSLGWSIDETRSLVYGQPLRTLVQSSGNRQFVEEFVGVGQYASWLSYDDAANLRSKLVTTVSSLSEDTIRSLPVMVTLSELEPEPIDPINLMANAYADALEMLETPKNENQALLIIYD